MAVGAVEEGNRTLKSRIHHNEERVRLGVSDAAGL